MATAAENLAALDAAIAVRLAGGMVQKFTHNGVTVEYPTLEDLQRFRRQLQLEASVAPGSGRSMFFQGDLS